MRDARQKELHRLSNARWREGHREQVRAINRKYRESNPGMRRIWAQRNPTSQRNHDVKRYGITAKQKEEIFVNQKGLCKLCGEPLAGIWVRDTHVEHKPNTMIVRGLVHCMCNQIIKAVEISPVLVEKAKEYLQR